VTVHLGDRSYPIVVGENLLESMADLVEEHSPAHRYAIISDSTVGRLYGPTVLQHLGGESRCSLFRFAEGESQKNRDTWQQLTDEMLAARLGRDTTVIALGGGVVGDLARFVAATYLRGVRVVQVPTSLLAMIDSSVGGKTGVDTVLGKNLVGAFHQPTVVITDVATLRTLPANHVSAGMAEAIKHGAISDAEYIQRVISRSGLILNLDPAALIEIVKRSVELKARVVAEDEKESGKRAVLNFGHTVGHAMEAASGYELLHGEAVGLGMLAEAAIGARLGITDEGVEQGLREAVSLLRLPTEPPATLLTGDLLDCMEQDKKGIAGSVRFALPARLGEMARGPGGSWTHIVPEAVTKQVLDRRS
jgi:3-dehydroquinate synthase